jgi:dipeptidyl aminopeptidase/acylaminoacyl peptidase
VNPFNGYVRRRGLWPNAITGWDPATEPEKFVPYLPVRNVTPAYPPTFLMHGREDSDVPYAVAEQMAAELARHGVEHRLVGIEGGEHGYQGADPAVVAAGHRDALAFVRRFLGPARHPSTQ